MRISTVTLVVEVTQNVLLLVVAGKIAKQIRALDFGLDCMSVLSTTRHQ